MVTHAHPRDTLTRSGSRAVVRAVRQAWDRVVVLANRAPFGHERGTDGSIRRKPSASGLVTALEPLVEACAGTWVAYGGPPGHDDAMCVARASAVDAAYRLRHVHLADEEHRGYYYGFANEGLWPLCHAVHVQPVFRADDFGMYQRANARFAAAAAEEAAHGSPLVLVQDYHLALAPRMLRQRLPASTVLAFWHIPWPHPRVFSTCPWDRALLEGLLGSDIVGFQTPQDCVNFLEAVDATLSADISGDTVTHRGRATRVRAYPVGIDWHNAHVRSAPAPDVCRADVCRDLRLPASVRLGIGIDRLDYTKGLDEKFLAIECLLQQHPELRERFVFVQVAEPSRESLGAYRSARSRIAATAERVNARFGSALYRPIVLLETHHEPRDVYRLYRAADFCYVGSLHDGMNLVAKEFVCARDDERGVLVLSRFAGAAQQLQSALRVNPYAVEQSAAVLAAALTMTDAEQRARMRRLRSIVRTFDTYWWAGQMVRDAAVDRTTRPASAATRRAAAERLSA